MIHLSKFQTCRAVKTNAKIMAPRDHEVLAFDGLVEPLVIKYGQIKASTICGVIDRAGVCSSLVAIIIVVVIMFVARGFSTPQVVV